MAGATGLDYAACIVTLQLYLPQWRLTARPGDAIQHTEVSQMLDDLRVIEQTLLAAWAEKAERERPANKGDEA